MAETTRHDSWQAGDNYEAYMGRWSRQIAPLFLDWLGARIGLAGGRLREWRAICRDPGPMQAQDPGLQ